MSQGKIWPEYWIDCAGCSDCEPIGETTEMRAELAANLRLQYHKLGGKWFCPKCVKKQDDENKLLDAIAQNPDAVFLTNAKDGE